MLIKLLLLQIIKAYVKHSWAVEYKQFLSNHNSHIDSNYGDSVNVINRDVHKFKQML